MNEEKYLLSVVMHVVRYLIKGSFIRMKKKLGRKTKQSSYVEHVFAFSGRKSENKFFSDVGWKLR